MLTTNYEEFLLEQTIYNNLINESVLNFSDKFVDMLMMIDSPISKRLLSYRNEDVSVDSNYFDVSSRDSIGFIADSKAQKLIKDNKEFVYSLNNKNDQYRGLKTPEGWILTRNGIEIETDEEIIGKLKSELSIFGDPDFILENRLGKEIEESDSGEIVKLIRLIESEGILAIVKFGEHFVMTTLTNLVRKEAGYYKNRQTIRVGRGIRAILKSLGEEFSDKEIEDFVNKWKSSADILADEFAFFEVVSGQDIAHWYHYTNYELGTNKGTLGSSCMCRKSGTFFEMYTENPKVCSLVILKSLKDKTKIKGRALLWQTDKGPFMDRVYTHYDSDFELFKKYAKKNGWMKKRMESSTAGQVLTIFPDGTTDYCYFTVVLESMSYDYYPYMDTLKYMKDRVKITISSDSTDADYSLESTDGDRTDLYCYDCDNRRWVRCEACRGSGKVKKDCEKCEGSGVITGLDEDGNLISCEKCNGRQVYKDESGKYLPCNACTTETCDECDGDGEYKVECSNCEGSGEQRCTSCA